LLLIHLMSGILSRGCVSLWYQSLGFPRQLQDATPGPDAIVLFFGPPLPLAAPSPIIRLYKQIAREQRRECAFLSPGGPPRSRALLLIVNEASRVHSWSWKTEDSSSGIRNDSSLATRKVYVRPLHLFRPITFIPPISIAALELTGSSLRPSLGSILDGRGRKVNRETRWPRAGSPSHSQIELKTTLEAWHSANNRRLFIVGSQGKPNHGLPRKPRCNLPLNSLPQTRFNARQSCHQVASSSLSRKPPRGFARGASSSDEIWKTRSTITATCGKCLLSLSLSSPLTYARYLKHVIVYLDKVFSRSVWSASLFGTGCSGIGNWYCRSALYSRSMMY